MQYKNIANVIINDKEIKLIINKYKWNKVDLNSIRILIKVTVQKRGEFVWCILEGWKCLLNFKYLKVYKIL